MGNKSLENNDIGTIANFTYQAYSFLKYTRDTIHPTLNWSQQDKFLQYFYYSYLLL